MTHSPPRPTLLVLSQVYVPDPASVGQHMADAAAEMVRRGWRVVVLTSARGYNDASIKYKPRETIDGVEIIRLPLSSFGKKSFALRILAALLFMVQTIIRGVFIGNVRAILVSTSPPMCIIAALKIWLFKLGRPAIKFWVMDINPDQLISLGKIGPNSLPARLMNLFNRIILRRSADVIVLDKFMARTMNNKLDTTEKMAILPPWPHEDSVEPVAHDANPFRAEHALAGKRVFMYSGNHGIALPLDTFLKAAVRFKDDSRAAFLFIGDGVRKREVEACIREQGMANMLSLPYQPLARLRFSLSAADAHLVSVGDEAVGTIHPCKIYGAMAVARPIILLAPDPCHVSDLVKGERGQEDFAPAERTPIGWIIPHGDVDRAAAVIREILDAPADRLAAMGERARHVVETQLSKRTLCGAFCDVLERGVRK
ncbi:MAG: glycosyltransferase family 4 protein [Phycisphaeraceae bacterium]|nr:glycosyltransferase family 4 protein [Phycisphaeraceae bacterium]MBX3405438.1 glycosyltransferase family 4 protein [Phycisphaeraceae bacterium]